MHSQASLGKSLQTQHTVRSRQGYVYVLDSEGAAREGWPVQMGDVQAQVAVADIDCDAPHVRPARRWLKPQRWGPCCLPGCAGGVFRPVGRPLSSWFQSAGLPH
jgi:hypothetical protein